jgi:hypothetical protein
MRLHPPTITRPPDSEFWILSPDFYPKNPFKNAKIKPNQTKSDLRMKPIASNPQKGWVELRRDSTCLRQQAPWAWPTVGFTNHNPTPFGTPACRSSFCIFKTDTPANPSKSG